MLGFEECPALEELYLSHNGIWQIEVGVPASSNSKQDAELYAMLSLEYA
jgi:hypothetical protein